MVKLNWDGNDFQNSQDSSGTTSDNISGSGNLQQGYDHGSLTRGLVAYYPMEKGEGEVLHDGALSALGNIRGADWITDSPIGNNSLDFDASNGEDVDLGRNYRYTEGGPWTISVHFHSRDVSSTRQFVTDNSENKSNNTPITRNLGYRNGKLTVYTGDSGSWVYGNTTLNNNQWYHAVYRYNGDGTLTFYLDGEKDGTVSVQSDSSSYCDIGYLMSKNGTRHHDGYATDMRVYNRRLSKPEIEALANISQSSGVEKIEENVPGQNDRGISRYKLDGNIEDAWGENDGTNNGAVYTSERVYGDEAVIFSDNEEYIEVSDSSSLDLNSFTLSIWAKPSGSTGGDITYTFGNLFNRYGSYSWSDKQYGFALRYSDDFDYWEGGAVIGGNNTVLQGSQVEKEKWTHLVLIYDTTKLLLYEDGELKDSKSISGELQTRNSNALIGTGSSGRDHYLGAIDDVRIYSEALDPAQVEQLYHKGAYRIPRKSTLQ